MSKLSSVRRENSGVGDEVINGHDMENTSGLEDLTDFLTDEAACEHEVRGSRQL